MEKGNLWTVNKKYMKVESKKVKGVGGVGWCFVFFNLPSVKNPPCNKFTKALCVCFLIKSLYSTVLPCLEPKGKTARTLVARVNRHQVAPGAGFDGIWTGMQLKGTLFYLFRYHMVNHGG
jgi:hypothetical protein